MSDAIQNGKARAFAIFDALLRREGWTLLVPASGSLRLSLGDGEHDCVIIPCLHGGVLCSIYKHDRAPYAQGREPLEVVTLNVEKGDPRVGPLVALAGAIRDRLAPQPPGEAEFAAVERLVGIAPPTPDGATPG